MNGGPQGTGRDQRSILKQGHGASVMKKEGTREKPLEAKSCRNNNASFARKPGAVWEQVLEYHLSQQFVELCSNRLCQCTEPTESGLQRRLALCYLLSLGLSSHP